MNNITKNIMADMDFTDPATIEEIHAVEAQLGFEFPKSYVDFLLTSNGVEGPLGDENYLALWSVNEIVELNTEYAVKEFTPQLTYFGSDGGDVAYAFDTSEETVKIVEIPFESIDIKDKVYIADDFDGFILALSSM